MLIDAHTHNWDRQWIPKWFIEWAATSLSHKTGLTVEESAKRLERAYDSSGDMMVRKMDQFGVDKALICVADFGLVELLGDAELPIEEINRQHYEMVKRHPGRLYLAVGVDPRRKNAVEIIERGVKEWGAKALKLYPPAGWYPNDKIVYPLYKKCVELGIPVNFHTGPVRNHKSKYSHPIHIDDVASDFPDLVIHCTHTGYNTFMELLAIAEVKDNIVCDLAGWLPWAQSHQPHLFYSTLRFMMDKLGPGRLMFASDTIGGLEDRRYQDWINVVRQIPERAREAGIVFTDKELADFYSGTASRVLKL